MLSKNNRSSSLVVYPRDQEGMLSMVCLIPYSPTMMTMCIIQL